MHDDRRQVEERLERMLRHRIRPAVHPESVPLTLTAWDVPDEPVPAAEALAGLANSARPFAVGEQWGRPWSTIWIRAVGEVPAAWAGRRVEAWFDLGFIGDWPGGQAEALVYDAAGVPIKGLEPQNQYVPVTGDRVELLLEAAGNPDIMAGQAQPTLLGDKLTAPDTPLYTMARADLVVLDEQVWHLALDLEVAGQLMRELSTEDTRRHELLRAIEDALDAVDLEDVSASAPEARTRLAGVLSKPANASAHTISAIGHAHIDSAWLWPLRETERKAARTFANVTALAEVYPDFVFACSQAQQYAWVKQRWPHIYQRMQQAAKAGQWVPVGGMWVEADGNLPGGEAMARQLVHGKRLFAEEFGVECEGVWLPDSFGYNAAWPQLAKLAGMHWFLTQKISWNQTNKFPHHTFWWEGIDGSRVFTHFPPVDTYNAVLSGAEMAHAVRNYQEKGRGNRSLAPFGHGDGGGGPTREMMERARRLRDLEGSPKVVVQDPNEFFRLAQEEYADAPVWVGELYLELHRGTFTSQARTKAGNRRSEHLLREAELWSATAAVRTGLPYPYEQLDRLWKTALLHQFHDILPGSSIAWVHREAEATYAEVAAELTEIITRATTALAGEGDQTWVFNTSPRDRIGVVPASGDVEGVTQTVDGQVLALAQVPASGVAVVGGVEAAPVTVENFVLDNGLVRVEVDSRGLLTSVRDLVADREVLAPHAPGNLLQLHTDYPNHWDAWDIDAHYRRRRTDLTAVDSVTVTASGPLVGSVRVERSFGRSRVVQTISVCAGSPRVDVDTEIDWHETEKVLKAAFPLDIHTDRSAAEIQFGHVHRACHTNTSWDSARFEIYAHRWLHVGEPGYGVAVLNDSTYGHDVTRDVREDGGSTTTVRLSLVRAPRVPDPKADQGVHRFRYALLPGAQIADAVAGGYALNLPLRTASGGGEPPEPLVSTSGNAVAIEAVKLADDGSGDVVVRLYESLGGRARTVLRTSFAVREAWETDLLERPQSPLSVDTELALRPFQIRTIRLRR